MTPKNEWFAIDRAGLGALLERKGKWFAILELLQNCWDEKGVTTVQVELVSLERGKARLWVTDNSDDGYADLTHAFTLFAPSTKLNEAEKRGRFNLGEKLVLALCDSAEIISTTGGFRFDDTGRHTLRKRTTSGSTFKAVIRMTKAEVVEAIQHIHNVIVPDHITTTINGAEVAHRSVVHEFKVSLPTELADDEGRLRPTQRKTLVRLYDPMPGEKATVYELGIPIVEDPDGRYDIDVGQKVPLNMDRDNLTPSYLRTLRTFVLNEAAQMLTDEQATATWVADALSDPRAKPEAVREIVAKRFGDDAVIFDPNDQEANNIARMQGRTVMGGKTFSSEQWKNVKAAGFQAAGKVTPSPKMQSNPEAAGIDAIRRDDKVRFTPAMGVLLDYAERFGATVLGEKVTADVYPNLPVENAKSGHAEAAYGGNHLAFSLQALGKKFFEQPDQVQLDALLIHEFAHHAVSNHLSREFYDECCRLGALAKDNADVIGTVKGKYDALRQIEKGLRK